MFKNKFRTLWFVDEPAENEGGTDKPEETELTPEQMKESIAKLTRSLEASREDTKKAKSEAARVKDLEKQLEAANAEKLTEAEKAVAEARKEAAGEVTSKFTDRLISERVRSLAADQFAEPQDALMYLKNSGGFSSLTLNDELEIDNDAVKKALEDVAKARPHWLKEATKTATAGQAGIGGGGNAGGKRAASLGEALQARYNKTSK